LQTIADQARAHLKPGAWLLLEHGYNQAEAVCQILKQKGYTDVQSRKDLAGIVRCSGGQRAEVK
jgi:release factor glutamine methyltransferase